MIKPALLARLDSLRERLEEVAQLLGDQDVLADQKQFKALSMEHHELAPIIECYERFKSAEGDYEAAESMLSDPDPDMKELAREELAEAEQTRTELADELQRLLLPKDPADNSNVFLEIRAGTGGDEAAIFSGDLSVSDLETAWNDAYKASLGVSATRPSDGVLQDIHWSSGYFGYFPSYTIGNLYAASFKKQLESEMPTIWRSVRDGEFAPILAWLRSRIHERGAATTAHQIFTDAVGDRDPVSDLMDHLRSRHGALCGVG